MANEIITIGREFGSGGRELGRRLSELKGFPYYDEEIIKEIAKRTDLSEKYIAQVMDQRPTFSFPIHIGNRFVTSDPVVEQSTRIFAEQREILLEMAEKSNCVIVGRCADYILAEMHPIRLFVYADMPSKLARCRAKNPDEKRTDAELEKAIKEIDKGRASYYNHFTDQRWGDRKHYDLLVNTSNWDLRELATRLAELF